MARFYIGRRHVAGPLMYQLNPTDSQREDLEGLIAGQRERYNAASRNDAVP